MRIASWNLSGRTGVAATRLGSLLSERGGADLVLLQEVSRQGLPGFCNAAHLDWWVHIGAAFPDLLKVRGRAGGTRSDGTKLGSGRCVAVAGCGAPLRGATTFPDAPLPEKVLAGWIDVGGARTTVVSYHAPTGVQHKIKKPTQAVQIAQWLSTLETPTILGGDFNTPKTDSPDFDLVRTHWHTGDEHLEGAPGDDLLVGPNPVHDLRDALRTYLATRPEELQAIRAARPTGPLLTSYCTDSKGVNRCRYDAVWLIEHFSVLSVEYHYEDAVLADTDHALVIVETQSA